jgi:hypothetical protein
MAPLLLVWCRYYNEGIGRHGRTALHLAIIANKYDDVRLLCQHLTSNLGPEEAVLMNDFLGFLAVGLRARIDVGVLFTPSRMFQW